MTTGEYSSVEARQLAASTADEVTWIVTETGIFIHCWAEKKYVVHTAKSCKAKDGDRITFRKGKMIVHVDAKGVSKPRSTSK